MKRFLYLGLVVLLMASMLVGCESNEQKKKALMGTWELPCAMDASTVRTMLENVDLSEEEIALIDLNSFFYITFIEYGEDTFRVGIEPAGMRESVKAYYVSVFDDLYENRTVLNEVYSTSFDQLSKGEFQQFYAELYGKTNFTDLLDLFADASYNYEILNEDAQSGTYRIKGDKIWRTLTGETEEEYMGYKIEGDTLTLIYEDFEEVLTRVQ